MKYKKQLLFILRCFITFFLLYIIYRRIDIQYVLHLLKESNYIFLVLSLMIFILSNITGSIQWYFLLKSHNKESLPFFPVIKLYLFSAFFNNFLLSNVGGDVVKVYKMIKWKYDKNIIFSSIIWDRFFSIIVLVIFSLLTGYIVLKKALILYGIIILLILLSVFIILIKRYNLSSILLKLFSQIKNEKINYYVKEFLLSFKFYFQKSRYIIYFYSLSFLTQFFKIYFMVYIAKALNVPINFFEIFFIIPVIGIVSALPISINGMGVREYVGSFLYLYLQKDKAIISIFITIGNIIVILGNLMGVIFMFDKQDSFSFKKKPQSHRS